MVMFFKMAVPPASTRIAPFVPYWDDSSVAVESPVLYTSAFESSRYPPSSTRNAPCVGRGRAECCTCSGGRIRSGDLVSTGHGIRIQIRWRYPL
jgi:hypothetical protein